MHYFRLVAALALSITACAATSLRARAAEPLEAGIAFVEITPTTPFRMSGYFYERLSTGTKDPLFARAIVFRQGKETFAFVFCDLVGVTREISAPARDRASRDTGIPVDHIAVTGTHTHTGPLYFSSLHDEFHQLAAKAQGTDPYDSAPYRAQLIDKVADAIVQANAALVPVGLKSGYAIEDRLAFNRRFYMKNGSVQFNPPINSPEIIRPAGPIDPQVGIVLLSKPGEKIPLAGIVSFAMHLDTTGGTLFSADYVNSLSKRLQESFGPDFKTLFGTGTCGNINHRDVSKEKQREADEIGKMLGDTVVDAIHKGKIKSDGEPTLAARSTKVAAPLQEFTADEIAKATAKMPHVAAREVGTLEAAQTCKITDVERLKKAGYPGELEVQAVRLNHDTAIVLLPSEIFVEFGLAIKAASPFKTTLIVELANDDLAYIPTKRAFAEGSYEVTNSRVQPGTGEKLADAAIGLLKELQ
jgi:neutral ceramidase